MCRVKKIILIVVVSLFCLFPSVTYAISYQDDDAQVEFTIPTGWSEEEFHEERDYLDAKFVRNDTTFEQITYSYTDLWSEIPSYERAGQTRKEIDSSFFTKADIAYMYDIDESQVEITSYNGVQYFKANFTQATSAYGITMDIDLTTILRINNGYLYAFTYYCIPGENSNYSDFEELMSSVEYTAVVDVEIPTLSPAKEQADASYATPTYASSTQTDISTAEDIILSLLMTIIIYSLPIAIYRYAIRKKPLDKRKAKKITIIYGIIGFIFMSYLLFLIGGEVSTGGAVLFWSLINYQMLVRGRDTVSNTADIHSTRINDDSIGSSEPEKTSDSEVSINQIESQEPEIRSIVNEAARNTDDFTKKEAILNNSEMESKDIETANNQIMEDIERLNRLCQEGIITQNEFLTAKAKLLKSIK